MKKISEMTPGEALTEQALAVFKRRLEQARKKAVGGEFMLLLLPIIYYEAKRIILDFVADFVELYRRAED